MNSLMQSPIANCVHCTGDCRTFPPETHSFVSVAGPVQQRLAEALALTVEALGIATKQRESLIQTLKQQQEQHEQELEQAAIQVHLANQARDEACRQAAHRFQPFSASTCLRAEKFP